MRTKFVCIVAVFAVCLLATAVMAQGVIVDIKTDPLADSDTTVIHMARHSGTVPPTDPGAPVPPPPPLGAAGWAGTMVRIHLSDASEVDVQAILPAGTNHLRRYYPAGGPGPFVSGIPYPFGPSSAGMNSATIMFTVLVSNYQQSGEDLYSSINRPTFDLVLHAKNTNLGENSDTDIVVSFWDIWHTRPDPRTTTQIHFPNSVSKWLNSTPNWEQYHITFPPYDSMYNIPEGPPLDDPNGHWVHLPYSLPFHNASTQGSAFYKYFTNTATIGLEHIPEPAALMLFGLGISCAVMGVRSRNKRRA